MSNDERRRDVGGDIGSTCVVWPIWIPCMTLLFLLKTSWTHLLKYLFLSFFTQNYIKVNPFSLLSVFFLVAFYFVFFSNKGKVIDYVKQQPQTFIFFSRDGENGSLFSLCFFSQPFYFFFFSHSYNFSFCTHFCWSITNRTFMYNQSLFLKISLLLIYET